ncbi:MAG: DUF11 domain-containing protein [Parcubacteria group bacterium]
MKTSPKMARFVNFAWPNTLATALAMLSIFWLGSFSIMASTSLPAWPADNDWEPITLAGVPFADEEARKGCVDPTNGGTSPDPSEVDIGSQAVCLGPEHYNPGNKGQPNANAQNTYSAGFFYLDPNNDSQTCQALSDDYLYFRTRYAGNPYQNSPKSGFTNSFWWVTLDSDQDNKADFYIRLDGNGLKTDETLDLIYETGNDNNPTGEPVVVPHVNPIDTDLARALETPDNDTVGDTKEYFLDWRLPLSDFRNPSSEPAVCQGDVINIINISTSENPNNPFQKDLLMASGVSDPINLGKTYSISKKATDLNGGQLMVNDPVEYEITLTNQGDELPTFTLTDTLPSGATFVSEAYGSGSGIQVKYGGTTYNLTNLDDDPDAGGCPICRADFSADTVTLRGDSLAEAANLVLRFQVTFAAAGDYANQASGTVEGVTGKQFSDDPALDDGQDCDVPTVNNCNDGDSANDDATKVSVASPPTGADLQVTKVTNNPTPQVGATFNYTLIVLNAGPDDATNVVLNDLLPYGVSYVSDDAEGAYDQNTGAWSIGDLAVNGSANLVIEVTADHGTADQTIINSGNVKGEQTDPDLTNNTAAVSITAQPVNVVTPAAQEADLTVSKIVDRTSAYEQETISFTMSVHNNGPDDATGVNLKDILPAGLTYLSHSGSGNYVLSTGIWEVGNLAVTNTAALTISARVNDGMTGRTLTNGITISAADQLDNVPANNSAEAEAAVISAAALQDNQTSKNQTTKNSSNYLVDTGVGIGVSVLLGSALIMSAGLMMMTRDPKRILGTPS